MFLLCAPFPESSKADEQDPIGKREGREQRELDNWTGDGRVLLSLRDFQEGGKDFNCDFVINNSHYIC